MHLLVKWTCITALLIAGSLGFTAYPATASDQATVQAELKRAIVLFSANSFAKTIDGIDVVAASGAEHAAQILSALSRRRVYIVPGSETAVFRVGRDYFDFMTNAQTPSRPDGAKSVRVNNRIRNVIKSALGTLRLRAADPAQRITAAEAIFRARSSQDLAALDKLVQSEADPSVKRAFEEARAALIVASPDRSDADKVAAIEILRSRGDQDAIAALQPAITAEAVTVRDAATSAVKGIEQRLAALRQAQNIYYGLSLGSVLLLAAIGLAITFGVMGVINMAHGEMVMLGAYTTFVVQEVFRAYAPDAFDVSLLVAIPAAFLVAGAVGIAIERGIIRFLYGRPLETLLATWGVSLILQQAVRTIFGPTNREVGAPSYMSGGFELMGLAITYNRLWIIVFTLVVFACLLMILRYTTLGLQMRAVTQNRRMAASMGIRTGYVDAMTFGLGSGVAGIAGVALSQIDNVSPNLGQNYIIDSFMVVVFGGVGNLWGTLVSAFALGITNKLLEPWAGAVLAKILILVLLILFIQKRPRGLFALKGRAVET
ncbi:MAG: urea ABC transporter permease subunit UrtB [Pseudomonadota bacterium]